MGTCKCKALCWHTRLEHLHPDLPIVDLYNAPSALQQHPQELHWMRVALEALVCGLQKSVE
jgi:hypothetical protein